MNHILVVEDSAVDREIISRTLADSGFRVKCVEDAFQARESIAKEDPLLIVLDIELPRMSGGEFLGHLMRHHPLPVVVVTRGNEQSVGFEKYQSLGAVSTVSKPNSNADRSRFNAELLRVVDTISCFRTCTKEPKPVGTSRLAPPALNTSTKARVGRSFAANPMVIALGASTGGPVAVGEIVRHFVANSPPVLIAQHISDRFSTSLVQGLRRLTEMEVAIAEHGEQIVWGKVYVAPPEHHMEIDGAGRVKILSTVPTDRFTPSVNVLLNSLARNRHLTVVAALLTGMGSDGADGLLRLRQAGATTIAQSEETCAVFGMPRRAIEINAAGEVLKLSEIGPRIVSQCQSRSIESTPEKKSLELVSSAST